MQRLREIREWREEFGMGVSGGPVRVAQSGPDDEKKPPAVAQPDDISVDLHLDRE